MMYPENGTDAEKISYLRAACTRHLDRIEELEEKLELAEKANEGLVDRHQSRFWFEKYRAALAWNRQAREELVRWWGKPWSEILQELNLTHEECQGPAPSDMVEEVGYFEMPACGNCRRFDPGCRTIGHCLREKKKREVHPWGTCPHREPEEQSDD